MRYRWTFSVESSDKFPIDMLRYDACFPADSASVSRMIYSLDPELLTYGDNHQVTLISYSHEPTKARWSSFGWTVTTVKKEKVTWDAP